jgi:ribosomal protein S14
MLLNRPSLNGKPLRAWLEACSLPRGLSRKPISSQLLTYLVLSSQALRYLIRNTSLPQRVRAQAQLQLSQMHAYTRPTQIKNRCVASGTARAVFRDFRINRVSSCRNGWC